MITELALSGAYVVLALLATSATVWKWRPPFRPFVSVPTWQSGNMTVNTDWKGLV